MYLSLFARFILLLGGINYIVAFINKYNMFPYIHNPTVVQVFTAIISLAALKFIFDRDYYLPFLGKTVLPFPAQTKPSFATLKSVKLDNLPPNATVIYWGALNEETTYDNPQDAYGDYKNSGVAMSNVKGEAIVDIVCPSQYKVSKFGIMNKTLKKHIHYRYELPEYKGMFSPVFTKYVNDIC